MPPTPARSMARRRRSGPWGSGGRPQVKVSGKWYSSGGSDVLGQVDDGVLERQQRPRIDLEGQVEVERPSAALLGVQVDLPRLAQRVGLDEMALVVDVEAVVDRMVLQVGDIPRDVDDGHSRQSLPAAGRGPTAGSGRCRYGRGTWTTTCSWPSATGSSTPCRARSRRRRGLAAPGERPGPVRHRPGRRPSRPRGPRRGRAGVLSEESGRASPRVGVHRRGRPRGRLHQRLTGHPVVRHEHLRARRGRPPGGGRGQPRQRECVTTPCGAAARGAGPTGWRRRVARAATRPSWRSSGMPARHLGWAQFRAFGAAALEMCAVADGTLDAFSVGGRGPPGSVGLPGRGARVHRGRSHRGRPRRARTRHHGVLGSPGGCRIRNAGADGGPAAVVTGRGRVGHRWPAGVGFVEPNSPVALVCHIGEPTARRRRAIAPNPMPIGRAYRPGWNTGLTCIRTCASSAGAGISATRSGQTDRCVHPTEATSSGLQRGFAVVRSSRSRLPH